MSKQPYIPFYVGDYLKDTRALPLAVRGAWVDLILFMWDSPVRGELVGTPKEIARMIGCDMDEATFALNLLKQKGTADIDLLPTGEYRIVSRRMKRDAEISKKRSEAGISGVKAKFAKAKGQAKLKQNTDNDNDNEDDNRIYNGVSKNFGPETGEPYFIVDGNPMFRVTKLEGLEAFFQANKSIINNRDVADKFMRRRTGKKFNDFTHVWNDLNKFTEKQYA